MERSTSLKSVFVLAIIGFCMSTNGFAGLVSSDSTELIGNLADPSKPGCFKIQVDYDIYDQGGDYKVTFQLTHLGSDGSGESVVDVGLFTVYNGDYTSIGSEGAGVAPDWIDPLGTWSDRAVYYFDDGPPGFDSNFSDGEVSQLLFLTFDSAEIPQVVNIEIDSSTYGIYGEESITLVVPEPATMILLAGGAFLLRRRRR